MASTLPVDVPLTVYGGRPNLFPVLIKDNGTPRNLTGTDWVCEVRKRPLPNGELVATCDVTIRSQAGADVGYLDVSIPEDDSDEIKSGYMLELVQIDPVEQSWLRRRITYVAPVTDGGTVGS